MLIEYRRTDARNAVLHHEIVAVVGQGVRRVIVKPRHYFAEAAAFSAGLGADLTEANFCDAYAVFCLWIGFIQILDMETLEIERLLRNDRRRRGPEGNRFSSPGNDDNKNNRPDGDANRGQAEGTSFRKEKRQSHQDQDHDP